MKAIKIVDGVYWVGAIDYGLRSFHGYTTRRGSTYNAYLVIADKVALIDTVKAPFKDEMLARISSVIDPKKIDYIVSNHTEMDHTGCLPDVICEVNPERVLASEMGVRGLKMHFDFDREIEKVGDDETLDLGGKKLAFYETRMLHWPDSMFTYLVNDGVLFSQDGFGMHLATDERFDDEIDSDILLEETRRYYANILTPYSGLVGSVFDKISPIMKDVRFIAPDHGPIWRKGIANVLSWYSDWSKQESSKKVVVAYDTMWGSTKDMASAICESISSSGATAKMTPLSKFDRSDVATELIDAGGFVVGSPTINNGMFPTVADMLCYVKGLKFQNLVGAVFGSYGWSGEGTRDIASAMKAMGITMPFDVLSVMYRPKGEDIKKCRDFGARFASEMIK